MNSLVRRTIALIGAGAVTVGVETTSQPVILLNGTFEVYAVSIAVLLRYPSLMWDSNNETRMASAVFTGGTTFGVLSLAQGTGVELHVGAGALGFGLAMFGMATRIRAVDEVQT